MAFVFVIIFSLSKILITFSILFLSFLNPICTLFLRKKILCWHNCFFIFISILKLFMECSSKQASLCFILCEMEASLCHRMWFQVLYKIMYRHFMLLSHLATKMTIFIQKILYSDLWKNPNHKDLDEFHAYHSILSYLSTFIIVWYFFLLNKCY